MQVGELLVEGTLRLGLSGFDAHDRINLQLMVQQVRTPQAPWGIVDSGPFHAVLLVQGTREGDSPDMAVLRTHLPQPRQGERRMEPLMLRKPIRAATLKVALDAALLRLLAATG